MRIHILLFVFSTLLLAACTGSQATLPGTTVDVVAADAPRIKLAGWRTGILAEHPLVGRAWLPAERRLADWADISARIRGADFVLLGENHDNPDHHLFQARLLADLVEAGRRPGVAWEMIAVDRADDLDRYLSRPEATPEAMGAAVGWDDTGWPDWQMYLPIAKVAMQAGLPQAAGDLTRDDRRSIARAGLGGLSAGSAEMVAARAIWTPALDAALRQELVESHCGQLPGDVIPRMVDVQRARDVSLALAMVQVATDDGAVLIAGSGHVRRDRGVPLYLGVVQPAARTVVVGMFEVREGATDPGLYLADHGPDAFDILIFTPRADRKDPCATFARKKSG